MSENPDHLLPFHVASACHLNWLHLLSRVSLSPQSEPYFPRVAYLAILSSLLCAPALPSSSSHWHLYDTCRLLRNRSLLFQWRPQLNACALPSASTFGVFPSHVFLWKIGSFSCNIGHNRAREWWRSQVFSASARRENLLEWSSFALPTFRSS